MSNKAEIEIRMRKYCEGCGTTYNMGVLLAPREWSEDGIIIEHFRRGINELNRAMCEYCNKSTQQISMFEEPES